MSCCCWIKQYCTMCKLEQVNKLIVGNITYFSNWLPGSLMHTKTRNISGGAVQLRQSITIMSTLCKTSMSWVHCCTTCCAQTILNGMLLFLVLCWDSQGAVLLFMAWEFPKTATSQITWTIVKWSLSLFECEIPKIEPNGYFPVWGPVV